MKRRWPLIVGCILVIVIFGFYGWYRLNLRAVGSSLETSFTIAPGEGQIETAQRLQQAHLIRSRSAFLVFVTLHSLRSKLQSGTYLIKSKESTSRIAQKLAGGEVDQSHLTIPEGLTIAKIEQLARVKGIKPADFERAIQENYIFDFLASRPPGVSLEGYLFPDSYQVNNQTTAHELVMAMLTDFGRRVDPSLRSSLATQGLNLHQSLTLASIVEREVANPADRAIVAGIFLKRLRSGQGLESDVTVHYAADLMKTGFSTNLDSPYNTYRHKGLPPGPICNPGLASLQAVSHPSSTDYVYFVAGRDGVTHFAKTLDEHNRNVQKYLK